MVLEVKSLRAAKFVFKILAVFARFEMRTSRECRLGRFLHSLFSYRDSGVLAPWVILRGWSERPTRHLKGQFGKRGATVIRYPRGDVYLAGKRKRSKPGFFIYLEPQTDIPGKFLGRASNPEAIRDLAAIGFPTKPGSFLTYIDEVLGSHTVSLSLYLETQFFYSSAFRHIFGQWGIGFLHKALAATASELPRPAATATNHEFLGLVQLTSADHSSLSPFLYPVGVDRLYESLEPKGEFPVPAASRRGNRVTFTESTRLVGSRSEWQVASRAAIHADSSIVEDGFLRVYEYGADPSWDFVAGQSHQSLMGARYRDSRAVIVRKVEPDLILDEAISLVGRASSNWYHAIVEYLPRIIEANRLFPKEIPVIANDDLPLPARELLGRLTDRKLIFIPSKRSFEEPQAWYEVRKLHFRSPTMQLTDEVPRNLSDCLLEVDGAALRDFRSTVKELFSKSPSGPSKVFIKRVGHRSLLNQNEILTVAKKFGYEEVDPLTLSLSEQVGMFQGATHVIAPGGAIMTGYLFLREGASVVGLASRSIWDYPLGSTLASFSGSSFEHFVGPNEKRLVDYPHRRDRFQGSYSIHGETFERYLRKKSAAPIGHQKH